MSGTEMLAEIHEQPGVLRELCRRAADDWRVPRTLFRRNVSAVVVGSGSSFNAGLATRIYLEMLSGVPARVAPASEAFRHRVPGRPLAIGLSHSGSSTDVRDALKRARRQGCKTLALTNIEGSPITREADAALVTGAGVERAIPSTKGFTALIAASLLLAAHRADSVKTVVRDVKRAAHAMECAAVNGECARKVRSSSAVVFLGEGLLYPVARDGALKLLEITYIPALAYPPEEFRHGPIAVAEPGVSVVALSPLPRTMRADLAASGATVIELANDTKLPRQVRPLVRAAELQRLAHAVGTRLGRDIDHPRGLSKVVTT